MKECCEVNKKHNDERTSSWGQIRKDIGLIHEAEETTAVRLVVCRLLWSLI
jgi:hypothetical protein